jgi:Na+/melibiose symporter-like transporter
VDQQKSVILLFAVSTVLSIVSARLGLILTSEACGIVAMGVVSMTPFPFRSASSSPGIFQRLRPFFIGAGIFLFAQMVFWILPAPETAWLFYTEGAAFLLACGAGIVLMGVPLWRALGRMDTRRR